MYTIGGELHTTGTGTALTYKLVPIQNTNLGLSSLANLAWFQSQTPIERILLLSFNVKMTEFLKAPYMYIVKW